MSAEIFDDTPKETADAYAVRLFNYDLQWCPSIYEYTQKIFDSYQQIPDGAIELIRMKRAAQFITNSDSSNFDNSVEAVFNGELIGSQLLNYMHPECAPIAGLAHAYVQTNLEISQRMVVEDTRPYLDPVTEKVIVPPLNEPSLRREGRMAYFTKQLREALLNDTEEYGLPDQLETFLESIASKLSADRELIDLTKIGARLILNEHRNSSLNKLTNMFMDEYLVNSPVPAQEDFEETPPEKKIPEKARETFTPSDEALAELTGITHQAGDIDSFFTFEDGEFIRNNVYKKFKKLESITEGLDLRDEPATNATYAYLEEELEKFNEKYELVSKGDTLLICGDFFAFASDGERGAITRYQQHIEIRGEFNGIHIVEVPTNKELLKVIKREERGEGGIKNSSDGAVEYELHNLTFSPSLQIINPTIMVYDGIDTTPHVDNIFEITLDIPLIYKNISYQVLKAETK